MKRSKKRAVPAPKPKSAALRMLAQTIQLAARHDSSRNIIRDRDRFMLENTMLGEKLLELQEDVNETKKMISSNEAQIEGLMAVIEQR